MSVTTYDLGTVLMVPKGDWNSTTAYERLNLVRHNGTAWLCTVAAGQTSVGEEPSSSATNWEILVQDQSSVTSVNGQRGDVVIDESGLVHKAGTETITGAKTFSGAITVSGSLKSVTPSANSDSTDVATTAWVNDAIDANGSGDGVSVGTIIWSMASTVPSGYLLCNGSAVGRTTYPELFAAIGTKFGAGDGSTTFNLPNLIEKFIEGSSTAGTVKTAGLPNITGNIYSNNTGLTVEPNGAFLNELNVYTTVGYGITYGASSKGRLSFDASRSSSIYGNSNTVQPPAVTALPCIKAFSSVVGDATVVATNLTTDINNKADINLSNVPSSKGILTSSWKSGTEWYRVYSDGWIEQGGYKSFGTSTSGSITFNKSFSDTNYKITLTRFYSSSLNYNLQVTAKTISTISIIGGSSQLQGVDWQACGY